MSDIGKIYSFSMPFYDVRKGGMGYKARPALALYGPRNGDYTVLPVSTIKDPMNRDADFDIKIDPADFPKLGLREVSYIRTHKQTTAHQGSKYRYIGDLKGDYPAKYQEIIELVEKFSQEVTKNA